MCASPFQTVETPSISFVIFYFILKNPVQNLMHQNVPESFFLLPSKCVYTKRNFSSLESSSFSLFPCVCQVIFELSFRLILIIFHLPLTSFLIRSVARCIIVVMFPLSIIFSYTIVVVQFLKFGEKPAR